MCSLTLLHINRSYSDASCVEVFFFLYIFYNILNKVQLNCRRTRCALWAQAPPHVSVSGAASRGNNMVLLELSWLSMSSC